MGAKSRYEALKFGTPVEMGVFARMGSRGGVAGAGGGGGGRLGSGGGWWAVGNTEFRPRQKL